MAPSNARIRLVANDNANPASVPVPAAPSIRYKKLHNGSYGLLGTGRSPNVGDVVTVEKRDGSICEETVDRVLWSGNGQWIASIGRVPVRKAQPTQARTASAKRAGRGTQSASARARSAQPAQACATCGRPCHGPCRACTDLGDLLY